MKNCYLIILLLPVCVYAQNPVSIGTDGSGDDYFLDAKELFYYLDNSGDTLVVEIEHYNARPGDFGYSLAIDTDLNPSNGAAIPQPNIKNGSPNTSMKYDVALYVFQNGFFPGIFTEAYDASGPISLSYRFDTVTSDKGAFHIPIAALGGDADVNIIGFTGSFTISPSNSGPSDAIPDATYAQIRPGTIGLNEHTQNLNIYPNPAGEFFYITGAEENSTVQLLDMSGRLAARLPVKSGRIIIPAGLHGSYIVKAANENVLGKILIQ